MIPELIPPEQYGFRADWRQTCSTPITLIFQKKQQTKKTNPEILRYVTSYLLTTPSLWHATTKIHRKNNQFLISVNTFELNMNFQKSKIIHRPHLGSHAIGQEILIDSHSLTQVNKLKYLSFTVAQNNSVDSELDTRTSSVFEAIGERRKRVWLKKTSP